MSTSVINMWGGIMGLIEAFGYVINKYLESISCLLLTPYNLVVCHEKQLFRFGVVAFFVLGGILNEKKRISIRFYYQQQ